MTESKITVFESIVAELWQGLELGVYRFIKFFFE
jgi:hypothetical protein